MVIPSRVTNKRRREYDRDLYKARHLIEKFFARLKQYRAITTRYDKTARNFLGAIHRRCCTTGTSRVVKRGLRLSLEDGFLLSDAN